MQLGSKGTLEVCIPHHKFHTTFCSHSRKFRLCISLFSFQEVLANPDITLDHRFILSLVYDIAKVSASFVKCFQNYSGPMLQLVYVSFWTSVLIVEKLAKLVRRLGNKKTCHRKLTCL